MLSINWDEYKEYKKHSHKDTDNFTILLNFMKSYYNMTNPVEMFDTFYEDELVKMMLDKRDIQDAEDLENYLFKLNV